MQAGKYGDVARMVHVVTGVLLATENGMRVSVGISNSPPLGSCAY